MSDVMKKTSYTIAYCYACGEIGFGRKLPDGALKIVQGKDKRIRDLVSASARLAYDGKTLLVPGIPEADSFDKKRTALKKYKSWINRCLDNQAEVDTWNATHPRGTQVIVHSTASDGRACRASGRTTTKARLSGGKIFVRVQHLGENNWLPVSDLTFLEGGAA